NAAKQTVPATRSMVRGLLSILPGRAREYIPPTIEQWLQIYANESPNFEKMAARVQIALDDIAKRRDLAMAELNRFDELVEIANKLTDSYRKMKTELEAQSAGLSPEEKERAEQMLIIPLAQEIDEINNLIGVHQTLIAQKQQIILQADPVIRVVSRASTAVIVGLRNAAITHEDAQALKQAIHGAENMRRVLDRSIESTSRIIDQTSIATDRMLATSTYSHDQYLKNARLLAATLKRSREETELLLPTLNARIAAYDETLKLTAPE
ncbi:MAG TPA: hypothetical protein PKC28_04810, partial [Bdellovibrionales bacterium]|nr:hypothetical protein [Bdellovibrionales bacterium]